MAHSLPTPLPPVAADATLQVRALLERSSLRPGERERLHLLVDVTASGAPVDAVRPALSVVFVLDGSGSMSGEPLAQVVRSVSRMIGLLSPSDKVGVVVFSDQASVICPLRALSDDTRRGVQRRLTALRAGGGTNIEAGLRAAATVLGPRTPHERQVVLLLSDGQPTEGAATTVALGALAATMREDMSLSTLGFGARHDADVLAAISTSGGGQYWFIAEPDLAGVEFARALGAQSDIVADGIEVAFSPLDDVEVVGVLGQTVRFTREGPAVALPDLRPHQTRLTVAEVVVRAPREPGRLELIDVVVRFRAAGQSGVQTNRQRVSVDVVARPPALVLEAHHAAQMARAELARTQARQAADRGNWEQAAAILRRCIAELEQIPGYRLADGSPLSECVEQLFDEATEYEQKPSVERYAKFKATQLGIEVAQGAGHIADVGVDSARSAALLHGALGPVLPGHVVKVDAAGREVARYPLVSEMIVGRAPDNAIAVNSRSLSRRHSRFACRDSRLFVDDLGSTNGTIVNGRRVSAEHELQHGDLVLIGDVTFRIDLPHPATSARA
jgi:Ca-activated chloride channel family protein